MSVFHSISWDEHTRNEKALPELINAMVLAIREPARPTPFVRVAMEKSVVTRTDKAPSASRFKRRQRFVIRNEYHTFGIVSLGKPARKETKLLR
jgi:hypothetical protein